MLSTRRRVIAAKIEGEEGTAESISAADGGLLVIDPQFETDFSLVDRNDVTTNSLSKLATMVGAKACRITFRTELMGAGTAYSGANLPAIDKYLRACGMDATLVTSAGNESVTYRPAADPDASPSLTMFVYTDGIVQQARGCRGTLKSMVQFGQRTMFEFEFRGVYTTTIDGALIAPTFPTVQPPLALGATFSIASYAAKVENLEFDLANTLYLRPSLSAVDGFVSCSITDRNPVGTFDPELDLVANHDFFGRFKAGTPGALSLQVGSVQYNRATITAPQVVYTQIGNSERERAAVASVSFMMARNTGNDEFVVAFT